MLLVVKDFDKKKYARLNVISLKLGFKTTTDFLNYLYGYDFFLLNEDYKYDR